MKIHVLSQEFTC